MNFNEISKDRNRFRDLLFQRLDGGHADFVEQMRFIRKEREKGKKWSASGILIPLEFDFLREEYVVILNKRSIHVQQPGDLCCPGGAIERKFDRLLAYLLNWGLFPIKRSEPFKKLLQQHKQEKDIMLFILAGVLRECWEEMRLPPGKVEYLGCLPAYRLQNFSRIIFPIVGIIDGSWKARPNWEVDKIIQLPLNLFFSPANYALCSINTISPLQHKLGADFWELPCIVVPDEEGEEILWGATFKILLSFMESVFSLPLNDINPSRKIYKELPSYYYTGKSPKKNISDKSR